MGAVGVATKCRVFLTRLALAVSAGHVTNCGRRIDDETSEAAKGLSSEL
jgi:hypothetical protein